MIWSARLSCHTALLFLLIPFSISQNPFLDLMNTYNELQKIMGNLKRYSYDPVNIAPWYQPNNEPVIETETYDFIIVGSGSAGSVIAHRLSENPKWNILLLESGTEANYLTEAPMLAPALQFTQFNWGYLMEKQKDFGHNLVNQRVPFPRGRALGGTTVINYMIYTRGNPRDFDKWAAQGNPGWSYEDVLPYYMKSERAYNLSYADPHYHNTNGLLCVQNSFQGPLVEAFVEGGQDLGLPVVDYSSPNQIGVSTVQSNTCMGHRHSANSAFLVPIRHRKNLKVLTSAHVIRLLINHETRQTYGVEYVRENKKTYAAYVSKEVILSAGAYHSPQLLMLSGIGPEQHLNDLGIKTLVDAPVGENMHDHITFVGLNFLINERISSSPENVASKEAILDFLANRINRVSSLGGVEGIGYIKTHLHDDEDPNYPDIEWIFVGANVGADKGTASRRSMNIRDDVYYKYFYPLEETGVWTILPMLLHPKSIGYMRLKSTNPFDPPLFYGNYLTDPERIDIRTMIAAVRAIQRLSDTPTFQKYESRLSDIPMPGCEIYEFDSDDYWECAIRSMSITLHHQVGTCKMGPKEDPGAVVDPELRVYGIANLRVADTSIIPFALGAHTNAPSCMVGEKASDIIKAAWHEQ